MGFKPNYQFERKERERAKAAKKAARLEAKRAKPTDEDGEAVPNEGDEQSGDQDGA